MKESALPTGFESFQLDGSSGKFSYENIRNQNKELVLISAPSEFDINKLKGEQIVLHGSKILPSNQPESEHLTSKWELHSFLASSDRHLNILLPSDTQHKHVMSDPLSVTLNVVRNMQIPILKSPEKKKATRMPKPVGLKPRWVPFGSGDSNTCKNMKNMDHMVDKLKEETKKKNIVEDEKDMKFNIVNPDKRIDETVMVENVSRHKKKKKKKENQHEGEEKVMTAVKEKPNDVSSKIEVDSMEVESVANENKLKKKKKKKKQDDTEMVCSVSETEDKKDVQLPDTEQCNETGKEHKKKKKKKFTEVQEKANVITEGAIKKEDCVQIETSERNIYEHSKQESNLNVPQISETNEHEEKKTKKKKKKKVIVEQVDAEVNGHFHVKPGIDIKEEVKSQENVSNGEVQEKKKKKKKKQEQIVKQGDAEINGLFTVKTEDSIEEIKSHENVSHVKEQEKKKKRKKQKSIVIDDAISNKPFTPVVKTEDLEKTIEPNDNDQKHKRKRKKRKSLANGQDVDTKPTISELNLNNTSTLNSVVVGNTNSSKKSNKKRKRDSMISNNNEIKKIKMDSNNNSPSGNKKSVIYSSDLNSDAEEKLLGVVPKKRAFSN